MSQIPSAVIVIVFMVGLSLILNLIGNSLFEIMHAVLQNLEKRKGRLNNIQNPQYDNSGEDDEMDTSEITV